VAGCPKWYKYSALEFLPTRFSSAQEPPPHSTHLPFENMPKVIPSSISRGCVDVRTVTLKYPPSYFNVGAAGFRNVLTVVDEVAQAASPSVRPNRTKLPARKPLCGELVRPGKILSTVRQRAAPYSVMGRSQGIRPYSNHGDVLVCLSSYISRD
jgi:hypothetical protein